MKINLDAIAQIESSGNPDAENKVSGARGKFQITAVCLDDYNQFHGVKVTGEDLWNPKINERVANWYLHVRLPQILEAMDVPVTTFTICAAYNWGPGNLARWYKAANREELKQMRGVPRETVNYYRIYCQLIMQPEAK